MYNKTTSRSMTCTHKINSIYFLNMSASIQMKGVENADTVLVMSATPWTGFELTLVVIDTDCTDSCKSNYHTMKMTLNIGQPMLSDCCLTQDHFYNNFLKVL
jgi:hypothetical protein